MSPTSYQTALPRDHDRIVRLLRNGVNRVIATWRELMTHRIGLVAASSSAFAQRDLPAGFALDDQDRRRLRPRRSAVWPRIGKLAAGRVLRRQIAAEGGCRRGRHGRAGVVKLAKVSPKVWPKVSPSASLWLRLDHQAVDVALIDCERDLVARLDRAGGIVKGGVVGARAHGGADLWPQAQVAA